MASAYVFDRLHHLLEYMDAEKVLDEVFQALSSNEANDILEHIERHWDIPSLEDDLEEEDDEEEEDEDQAPMPHSIAPDGYAFSEKTGDLIRKVLDFPSKKEH